MTELSDAAARPDNEPPAPVATLQFRCPQCGAANHYAPGTDSLRCSACGAQVDIGPAATRIAEHPYDASVVDAPPVATIGAQTLTCAGCGAATDTDMLAGPCPFCAAPMVAGVLPAGVHPPDALVPFGIDQKAADAAFVAWVRSRRFAPGALKSIGSTESITGSYVPHWTFDSDTETDYVGQRGEHYWVTVTDQVPDGRGGTTTSSHQEQRTAWHHASGHVARRFFDVLVTAAGASAPERLDKAGPWPLHEAVPYRADYLAGFRSARYDVDPPTALPAAKAIMDQVIEGDCRADIGGDEQRVSRMDVGYYSLRFTLLLLPLWLATYVYAGTSYEVIVNANTGEVLGERPYSKAKIALAVLAGLIVVAAVVIGVLIARRR